MDHRKILGIDPSVALTQALVREAYKKAALKAHPDKNGGSQEKFTQVKEAYDTLMHSITHDEEEEGGGLFAGMTEDEFQEMIQRALFEHLFRKRTPTEDPSSSSSESEDYLKDTYAYKMKQSKTMYFNLI